MVRRYIGYLLISCIVLGIDWWTKWIVKTEMTLGQSIVVIENFFHITSHRNRGAAFGILQNQRWFFIIITIVIVIGVLWYMFHTIYQRRKLLSIALAFVLGGAIGNFVDRVVSGEVVDFFDFYFAFINYSFPIFNVADSAIVLGVGLILLDSIILWRKEKQKMVDQDG